MSACSSACGWCGRCTRYGWEESSSPKWRAVCDDCGRLLVHPKRDADGKVRCYDCGIKARRSA